MRTKKKTPTTIIDRFFIRSKTNDGDLAKQYFTVALGRAEPALIIKKLVLTKKSYKEGLIGPPAKVFKGNALFVETFGIKISTLIQVIERIQNTIKTKP